ncbi:GDCCVxC domain-containing (seleno)protein [Sneathiella sp.]|uniref:GDCCVxC domain-containing (seleno)protein n=1 Tax=Sneathiella sp. TaxID=1964365 RepID=UPI003564D7F6
METQSQNIELTSILTCPECGHSEAETMPTDACQWFYECKGCGLLLKPKAGDCCVYCSYGTVPCPPIQQGQNCCGTDEGGADQS